MDDLLSEFLVEAAEGLAELDQALLQLERVPTDAAPIGRIFRLVHTIKGTCGFLGLTRLETVAHSAESVIGLVRDGACQPTSALVTAVLDGIDAIRAIIGSLAETGREPPGDDAGLVARLAAFAHDHAAGPGTTPPQGPPELPDHEPPPPPEGEGESAAPPHPGTEPIVAAPTIRVALGVLENLMTLVSELVLARNQLLQISRAGTEPAFAAPLQRLSQITSDLQEGVVKTRMQPIGSAWSKLPRMVRDLARDLDKPIELRMLGAETEMDRQVLELIRDPLTHMVRNSADHGIEPTGKRRAKGKPPAGTITLSACHEGGQIIVTISDDGGGLPLDRIRAKLLANRLATEAEIASMTTAAIQGFIFHPGFSTASELTAVSGRGVGMDVVKTNLEQIGGTIAVESVAEVGTTFTLRIPLTLAIVAALIVRAGEQRFALPQSSVAELVLAPASKPGHPVTDGQILVDRIDGTPVLRLRDRLIPLVDLAQVLRLTKDVCDDGRDQHAGRDTYVVVVNAGGTTFGIAVDQVFDTEEIVVKPVSPILRNIPVFGGNTVLGDGAVIMILDPLGIARHAAITSMASLPGMPANAAATRPDVANSCDVIALLIFSAGLPARRAVPLNLVTRLERVDRDRIEGTGGCLVMQYGDRLMPLVPLSPCFDRMAQQIHPVLVFGDDDRTVGLIVDEIVDIVRERLRIEVSHPEPGLLGTAIISGEATDIVDVAHVLSIGDRHRSRPGTFRPTHACRLLVVDDSTFFRNMLMPTLAAVGFQVTAVPGGTEALALREAGQVFDAIISDIEMPGMDGLIFARTVRAGGRWVATPMIALSSRVEPEDVRLGLAAGFTDYMSKYDRQNLLDRLQRCLGPTLEIAA